MARIEFWSFCCQSSNRHHLQGLLTQTQCSNRFKHIITIKEVACSEGGAPALLQFHE